MEPTTVPCKCIAYHSLENQIQGLQAPSQSAVLLGFGAPLVTNSKLGLESPAVLGWPLEPQADVLKPWFCVVCKSQLSKWTQSPVEGTLDVGLRASISFPNASSLVGLLLL